MPSVSELSRMIEMTENLMNNPIPEVALLLRAIYGSDFKRLCEMRKEAENRASIA